MSLGVSAGASLLFSRIKIEFQNTIIHTTPSHTKKNQQAEDLWGQTPLWIGCCYGRPEEVRMLLEVKNGRIDLYVSIV